MIVQGSLHKTSAIAGIDEGFRSTILRVSAAKPRMNTETNMSHKHALLATLGRSKPFEELELSYMSGAAP